MAFTLADIDACIRNVTATPSTAELSTAALYDLINKFYLYVLPNDFKPFSLNVDYVFNTVQNTVNYKFDLTKYTAFEPEVFCNGNQLLYYQDRSLWIRDNKYQYNQSNVGSGNGTINAFSGTISTPPNIVPGTVRYTDGNEVFTDQALGTISPGIGLLSGSLGGTGQVNYSSGAWSITFNTAPLSGASILQTYAPLINGRPRTIYYDGAGNIQFSPIPDQTYIIECTALMLPTAFIASTDSPLIAQWGYTIAYGTSLELFRQRGQKDQAMAYQSDYEKYLDLSLSQSTEQSSNQRTIPKW